MNYRYAGIIAVGLIIFCSNSILQTFADGYLPPIGKLSYNPTICTIDPQPDSRFPNLSDKMTTETRNAVLDWELKLNNGNLGNNPWNMPIVEIPSSKANAYNKDNCDIIINFMPEPENPQEKLQEAGVEWIGNDGKSYINIYYLGVVFDMQRTEIMIAGSWYYNYTLAPHYATYFSSDPQLKSTIRHELGHALGLNHYIVSNNDIMKSIWQGTIDSPSIMITTEMNYGAMHFDITSIDISEVKTIYGYGGFPIVPHNSIPNSTSVSTIPKPIPSTNQFYPNPPIPPILPSPIASVPTPSKVPSWLKHNAKWWSEANISDDVFVSGIQYLVQHGILKIQNVPSNSVSHTIPGWVRSNAGLWSDGNISDYEFLRGMQYLVSIGLIKI